VAVLFPGNTSRVGCRVSELSHTPPPATLAGGFKVKEQVYFCRTSAGRAGRPRTATNSSTAPSARSWVRTRRRACCEPQGGYPQASLLWRCASGATSGTSAAASPS
jgi:hypothetical protein